MSTLTAFNTQLDRLLENLINYFPGNDNFKNFQTIFSLLKTTNPRKIMTLFKTYVTEKYKTQILEKNEEFFMENKFEEEKSNIKNDNYADDLIKQLKEHWSMIDEKNKDIIWKYFQVLVVLSEKD
jgi:hypothetical protein